MYKPRLDPWPGRSRPHPPSLKRLNLVKEAILASTMLERNIHVRGLVTKPFNLMSDLVGLLTVAMQYSISI